MKYMTFFSIIVPVYKVEKYLDQCIQSILSQTYKNYELILVDDGSPDNCPRICDNYAANDTRVKVIHKSNGGLSEARNFGLAKANGKFIIFLDSDDFWCSKNNLKNIYDKLIKENVDILILGKKKYYQNSNCYSDIVIPKISKKTEVYSENIKQLMENNIFVACAWDKVVSHKIIKENNIKFVHQQLSEDIEWCSKLLLSKPKISVLNEIVYIYRKQNSESISSNIKRDNLEHICNVLIKYIDIGMKQGNVELLNFMAEQYVLWMTISNFVKKSEITDLISKLKKLWFIINYNYYPHVKLVYKVKILGYEIIRKCLGLYKKFKDRHIL